MPESSTDLTGLIRKQMCKRAQEIVTNRVLPKDYVAPAEIARRRQAKADEQARQARMHGRTGYEAYDNLPDVVRARVRANAAAAYERHAASNPNIVKRKSMAEVIREHDANGGVSRWGDSPVARGILGTLGAPVKALVDAAGSNISYLTSAPKGTSYKDWQKNYWKNSWKNYYGNEARDVAANLQLQADNARHTATQLGHWAVRALDPRAYGNSTKAKDLQRSYANDRANEYTAFLDRQRRILGGFSDTDLKNPDKSLLGAINYGAQAGLGQYAGGALATAGAGTAAGSMARGITRGTGAVSNAIRGSAVGQGASRGARFVAGARNMAANGVDAMGDTVAFPFKAVGTLADPVSSLAKGVPAVGRGVRDTVSAGFRPVADAWRVAHNPAILRNAYRANPWQFAKSTAMYPVRWAGNTLKPAWNAVMSQPGLEADAAYGMWDAAGRGDYGTAAGELGTMGMYGAAGNMMLPFIIAQSMYGAQPQE